MASQLVTDVRRLIADRTDNGAPLTALERTFLLAAIAPRTNAAADVLADLEDAITYARRVLLSEPPAGTDPTIVAQRRREAAGRLIATARAAIDHDPYLNLDPTDTLDTIPADPRPKRADVDG